MEKMTTDVPILQPQVGEFPGEYLLGYLESTSGLWILDDCDERKIPQFFQPILNEPPRPLETTDLQIIRQQFMSKK